MTRKRGEGGLRHVSDILRDVSEAEPSVPVSSGHRPSWTCPCAECMRAYLDAVQRGAA